MNEEKELQTPQTEEPDITDFSLSTVREGKPPRKISMTAAIILAVFVAIAAFMLAFVVVSVQTASQLREMDAVYGKYSKMEDLLNHLDANYVRDYDMDAVWEGMYGAIFDSIGDPYSTYMTKEEYAAYKADRSGNYVGIGVNVVYTAEINECYVYRVSKGSPAEKAGILPGDLILAVEDIEITLETYQAAIDAVAGEEETSVNLTLKRDEQIIKIIVTRNKLETINVLYEKLPGNIAYITIISFAEAVTYDQFAQALEQAKEDKVEGYIFDVRNNPGGSLDVICKCLDLLLPEGIIVNIVAPDGTTTTKNSDAEHFLNAPMVVLCNESTASAAELFTADLRDFGMAVIVGETTFGKGTMQTISPLADGSAVKLTNRYYNPSGNVSYDGIGIKPDEGYEIILTEEEKKQFYKMTREEDRQFQAALRALEAQ